MPTQNQTADLDLGYAQFTCDTSTLVSSATFGNAAAAGIPPGTKLLLIQPQTQAIRVRSDGIAPTAAIGYPVAVGTEMRFTAGQFASLRVISQTAGAVVNVWAFG